jgi:large subunit ribosomal protein L5
MKKPTKPQQQKPSVPKKGKGDAASGPQYSVGSAAKLPSRLRERYNDLVVKQLRDTFGYKNPLEVPKLQKIVINMGVGKAGQTGGDPKLLDKAVQEMALISGQKPVVTKAKKSISNFKVREGAKVGCKVTLRGRMMYHFMDKLVNIVLPRLRDFSGVSNKSFDGRGNYALGMKEQLVFPEIDYDSVDVTRGMDIIFVTTAKNDEEGLHLLKLMGMPFKN